MSTELHALEANSTWTLEPLPLDKKPIVCKWVFKTNLKADGSIERYKTRLVVKGYTQVKGLDYHEIFAPVCKMSTVRCLLVVAATQQWIIHQLDINNAFLHGNLDEEVYMTPPLDFTQFQVDHSLFTLVISTSITIILVYVDDILWIAHFPMEQNLKLTNQDGNIVFAMNILSQFMHAPHVPHMQAATRVLRYIKGSPRQDILFSSFSSLHVTAYTDSDWANCPTTRRSTIGYFI
ncbi:hypothetical protein F2P56_008440 [Juglans regia]|uniref:Reverse transcriptase Ty1/copia-type domain-containing protein n=1 Tax=Juglans regia TaxID=51240 RepID=A0A833XV86_JUGRE|nr:hypothetical protein F2P56_008440 [Juglans regia]